MEMSQSDSMDGFDAFMAASNEDDESVTLKKNFKGSGVKEASAPWQQNDYSGGRLSRSGGDMGVMGGSGRGQAMGDSAGRGSHRGHFSRSGSDDPLAQIDLDSCKMPERPVAKPRALQKHKQETSKPPTKSAASSKKPAKEAGRPSRVGHDVLSSSNRSSRDCVALDITPDSSLSNSKEDLSTVAEADGQASKSIFADTMKEWQQMTDSAEELRKRHEEDKLREVQRLQEEEDKRRIEEEEKRRHKEEEEERRRLLDEEERRRREEEDERRRIAEEEEQRRKREEEEEERRKKQAEEKEMRRKLQEEEERRKKAEEEEEQMRRKETEDAEKRRQAAEEEARCKQAEEEEEARRKHMEQLKLKAKEEESEKKQQDEENNERRRRADEEIERAKKAKEEEVDRLKWHEQEVESGGRRAEEDEVRKRARAEEEEEVQRQLPVPPRSLEPSADDDSAGNVVGVAQRRVFAADSFEVPEPLQDSLDERRQWMTVGCLPANQIDPLDELRRRSAVELKDQEPTPPPTAPAALAQKEEQKVRTDLLAHSEHSFAMPGAQSVPQTEMPGRSRSSSPPVDDAQGFRKSLEGTCETSAVAAPGIGRRGGGLPPRPDSSANSITPLMASVVRDSMGELPSSSVRVEQGDSGTTTSVPTRDVRLDEGDDGQRFPCDLVWRLTDSGDAEESRAFWRAKGLSASQAERTPGGGLDLASSVNLGSTVCSGTGLTGLRKTVTLRPEDLQASLVDGVTQRIEHAKFEGLQAEIQGLRKKILMLEEFNVELTRAKARAEAEAVRLDEQVMWLRLEGRKLQDTNTASASALREATMGKHELQQRLDACESSLADRIAGAAREAATTKGREEQLAERVAALQRENTCLREECAGLREDVALKPGTLEPDRCGDDRLAKLQADLQMAESMLHGCEKENQNLAQQNRQLRQGARLRKEEVDGRQLQLVAELNAARASADTNPASVRRVGELEREVVSAKERTEELARELDRCREAKRQLERELLHGSPPVPAAETSSELAEARAAHSTAEAEAAELRKKLLWYVESQREMEDDRREAVHLSEEVRRLRTENSELKRRPGAKEANRRTAELQKQVGQLQESLRKRHPDSILSLVKACEPRPEERRELRDLRSRVEELEAKLSERDATYDRQVRALRAHYDHMRQEYEKRAEVRAPGSGLEAGGLSAGGASPDAGLVDGRKAAPDREAVLTARIQDLERQVEHTKSYYLTKLRKREPLVPPKSSSSRGRHREAELQLELRERDARLAELTEELRWHQMEDTSRAPELGAQDKHPSSPQAEKAVPLGASMLRLFLASPEAAPVIALSIELRAMMHAARRRRYDEVASQARALLVVLCTEETASGMLAASDPSCSSSGQDVLRLRAQPPLPRQVWSSWRRLAERVASVAAEASLRGQEGVRGVNGSDVSDVAGALAALCLCVDGALCGLVFSPAGSGVGRESDSGSRRQAVAEAWGADESLVPVRVESLLPRLVLERVREELDAAGSGHAVALAQDADVHAGGVDHRLPWRELAGALSRCSVGGPKLLGECRLAAQPDWTLPLAELRQLLGTEGGMRPLQAPCWGIVRTLTRIRMVAGDHEPPLPALFRCLDADGRGFLSRQEFMEALRGIHCALSPEERGQLAVFFSPAIDPGWVCYPLLLQSVIPTRGEAVIAPPVFTATTSQPPTAAAPEVRVPGAAVRLDALARAAELEADNLDLRERVRTLTAKCAENAALVAQTPVQAVRRLQGEVAALETHMLEQHTVLSTTSRKAEITLRGELEVSRHETASLRETVDMKDRMLEERGREVARYKCELESIIMELAALRDG